jgi:hypothetical protein
MDFEQLAGPFISPPTSFFLSIPLILELLGRKKHLRKDHAIDVIPHVFEKVPLNAKDDLLRQRWDFSPKGSLYAKNFIVAGI